MSREQWRSVSGDDNLPGCSRSRTPAIIQHAVWLYFRFTLSYRDVEDLLAERGLGVSYETVRRWVGKFGPAIARNLRQLRCKPSSRWHLDEMVVRIVGKQMYLWRAVDDEGEVLEVLIQRRRNKAAARKLIRKLLRKHGFAPTQVSRIVVSRRRSSANTWLTTSCRKLYPGTTTRCVSK